ncbi:MAG: DASS family sodium-coupled anion symporter [Sphingobacteriales bacterium]|nr:DASS family sodium-coupled anion symporter [Sphingobacteriales bacterium]
MKKWFEYNKRNLALITGILLFLLLFFLNPLSLSSKPNLVLAISVLMISWWVLDAMPLPVVALVPIVAFPLFNISTIKEVTKSYSDSIIYLFMGGFFLSIAIEKWNLHKRVALGIIKLTGTNGNRIILGFILATGFLSMWLSNTATTMMMFPIAMSVIHVVGINQTSEKNMKNFSLVLMLSIAYASNFALGTIIGTPPNVAYVNYISDKFNYNIGFTDWMLVFTPLTIALLLMLYWVMVKWLYPNHIKHNEAGRLFINEEIKKMGKFSTPEIRTTIVFSLTVLAWILKDVINAVQQIVVLDDTIIAMSAAIVLFIIPSGVKVDDKKVPLLEWADTTKMAWGILLLFGGGIALAKALEDAKLMDQFGLFLASYSTGNTFFMILIVTTASVFLSEVMSNVAQVIVMAPVISSVAISLHMDPLLLGIPMTLGASCASMLPMGTPPNAIVFASGHIHIKDMIKTGFVLNIICIILITLFCYFLQPMIMMVK